MGMDREPPIYDNRLRDWMKRSNKNEYILVSPPEGKLGTISSFQVTHLCLGELMKWGNFVVNKSIRKNYWMLLVFTKLFLCMKAWQSTEP